MQTLQEKINSNELLKSLGIDAEAAAKAIALLQKQRLEINPEYDASKLDEIELLVEAMSRRRFMPAHDGLYTVLGPEFNFRPYEYNKTVNLAVDRLLKIKDEGGSLYQLNCTNWGGSRDRYQVNGRTIILPYVVTNDRILGSLGNGSHVEWLKVVPSLVGAMLRVTNHHQQIDVYRMSNGKELKAIPVRQVDVVRLNGETVDRPAATWTEIK